MIDSYEGRKGSFEIAIVRSSSGNFAFQPLGELCIRRVGESKRSNFAPVIGSTCSCVRSFGGFRSAIGGYVRGNI